MKCIIVDDEPLAREGLQNLIMQQPGLDLIESFSSVEAASPVIETNIVDLIFLDIQLPKENGLDFARIVPEKTLIIFTTAFPQYALESYEVDAIDYLVKPIAPERFDRAVKRAEQYWQMLNASKGLLEDVDNDYIFIRANRKTFKIQFDEITFIAALKDYVVINTKETKLITWMNLKTIHSRLPQKRFLRASKSYLVNKDAITTFDNNTVYIQDVEIPIGKTYQTQFFNSYFAK